jgi:hypothetical protein
MADVKQGTRARLRGGLLRMLKMAVLGFQKALRGAPCRELKTPNVTYRDDPREVTSSLACNATASLIAAQCSAL